MDWYCPGASLQFCGVTTHVNYSSLLALEWSVDDENELVEQFVSHDPVCVSHNLTSSSHLREKFGALYSTIPGVFNKDTEALGQEALIPKEDDVLLNTLDDSFLLEEVALSIRHVNYIIDLESVTHRVPGYGFLVLHQLLVDLIHPQLLDLSLL
jgi:hypothetical protein